MPLKPMVIGSAGVRLVPVPRQGIWSSREPSAADPKTKGGLWRQRRIVAGLSGVVCFNSSVIIIVKSRT